MAQMIPNRSENDIKNKWNSMKRKEQRSRRKQTRARPGSKNPPSVGAPLGSKTDQAGNAGNKKAVSFAHPLAMPALDNSSPVFDGAGEETIVPHET